jgi:hypothetical protein
MAGKRSEHRLRALINGTIRFNQLYGSLKLFRRNIGKQARRFHGREGIDPAPSHMAPSGDPATAKIAITVINENRLVLRFHFDFLKLRRNALPPVISCVLVDFDGA